LRVIYSGAITNDQPTDFVEQTLPKARKLQRPAVDALLRYFHPQVCRLACALCGLDPFGKAVVHTVMRQSLKALPNWRHSGDPANWFLHHTVLKCRELATPIPNPADDSLTRGNPNPSPQYLAFVRALRLLPIQQREAFLLFRAEKLDPRQVAVAMDCSTGAANNHHTAAAKALAAISAGAFESCAAELTRVYSTLTLPDDLVVGDISQITGRVYWSRLGRFLKRITIFAIFTALAWFIWRIARMIEI
jgi:DNA-directed RNA polymerase specialized sigma24 family protein